MKKRVLATLVSGVLVLSLAACGGNGGTQDTGAAGSAETAEVPAGNEGAAEGGLKIGIVTSSGVDDGSFGQDCYTGIVDFTKANPESGVTAVKEPDVGKIVQAVADVVADYDVMVMPGFQFAASGTIAMDNPDKKFILVDAFPKNGDEEVVLDNMYAMTFKEQESGFFAGLAAALESKTKKVAVVNGIAFPSNVNWQYGFMSGVNYANAHYDTGVTLVELPSYASSDVKNNPVGGNYIGSFADQATGKVVGEALLAEGVDIMLVAAGDSGNGVFAAIKEAGDGIYAIGCDVDQYDDGETGTRNIILTSALKNMRPVVNARLEAIKAGTFKGENAILGASDGATGYVKTEGRHQLSADTITKLDEAFELVKDGTVVPASNFNGHMPADFPGLK